jgi:hypothetical protein
MGPTVGEESISVSAEDRHHHHHVAVKESGHVLARSSLIRPKVSLKVVL